MEITITTHIRVSSKNKQQVRYLIEKLVELEAISSEDKNIIKDMTEALDQ